MKYAMKKYTKIILAVLLALLGLILATALGLCAAVLVSSVRVKKESARLQERHVAALEEEYSKPDFAPASELDMSGFDIAVALENNIRLNEVQFLGTHNSYKAYNRFADQLMRRLIGPLGFSDGRVWSYGYEPLSAQLENGIRSFELDVMREKKGFRCAHIPLVDYASVCPDFNLALKEIALWSDAHPGHLPITLLIEAKPTIFSGGMLLHPFNLDDVLFLDELVAAALGDRLYTPKDMLRAHDDFKQMRAADDYPALSELLGKILVIYHYDWNTTEAYAAVDPATRALSMFPSMGQWVLYWQDMDPNQAYVCFIIDNWSESPDMRQNVEVSNMLVRTRVDVFPWRDDEWEAQALRTGAFIMTTDWPPRGNPGEDPHVASFEDGATVRLKP